MVTTDVFENLKTLQDILVKKYDLEKKVDESPKQLDSQNELLKRYKEEFISKNHEYESLKEKISKLKVELTEILMVIENNEKGMDNITTHREYEALDKQIIEQKNKEQEIRNEIQKEEKKLAEMNENLKNYEEAIKSQESDLNNGKQFLDTKLSEYQKDLAELKVKEDEIVPNMDQEILFKFQRIIQRNDKGIVPVKNGVCTGCNMILPAQFANKIRQGEEIMFCPYCSRVLFYEETNEAEDENYFNIADIGSLVDLSDDEDDEGKSRKHSLDSDEDYDDSSLDSDEIEDETDEEIDDKSDEDEDDEDTSDSSDDSE
jgi:uncharacterized protein